MPDNSYYDNDKTEQEDQINDSIAGFVDLIAELAAERLYKEHIAKHEQQKTPDS